MCCEMVHPKKLKEIARAKRNHAHVPYSGFSVGAAVQTEEGDVYGGANVEIHGRKSIHAEEMACARAAIDSGGNRIIAIAVSTEDHEAHVPCGRCLGFIAEFSDVCRILMDDAPGWQATTLDKELPNAYRGNRDR